MTIIKLLLACALLLAVGFAAGHQARPRRVGMVIGIKPEQLAAV